MMGRLWVARVARAAAGLLAGVVLAGCGGGGEGASATQRHVSVRIDSALATGESFGFALGGQSATVTQSGVAVAFGTALDEGSAYTVSQTAGPRACTLSANRTGTIGSADVLVTANCGTPPASYTLSVVVTSPIGAGETFVFTRGSGINVSITQANVTTAFAGTLVDGSGWTVTQLSGPRTCTLSPNAGTIAGANAVASANCGSPAATSQLSGELRAPVGTQVTLRNNGGDDLALTMPAFATDLYNALTFTFATPLADGSAYAVTAPNKPANQTCSVYSGASGTMPLATGALKVGCEYTYDLVSRSSTNVLATRVESWKPSLGGAGVAIGNTPTAYGEGRFVVFSSAATGLSPNGFRQVFWRDRWTGDTVLVSASAAGDPGNGNSDRAAISADGLTVVFESFASNLVAGDTNGVRDVFLWSVPGGGSSVSAGLQRISVGPGGVQANAQSYAAVISGDGRVAAFVSEASNVIGAATGGSVMRRDINAGTNVVASTTTGGAPTGGDRPSISEDGNRIAFWSFASDIVPGDSNGLWDIFVYQHSDGSKRRISLRADGGERNQGSDSTSGVRQPVISGNGRFVAYATGSTNVVGGDTNGVDDIFVVDLDGALGVRRGSVSATGAEGNAQSGNGNFSENVALSFDGTWMVFISDATNFGTTANGRNVFLRHLGTGEVRVITNATFGVDEVSISRSAAYVGLGAGAQLDSRFASSGQFVHFTGLARAWWWID